VDEKQPGGQDYFLCSSRDGRLASPLRSFQTSTGSSDGTNAQSSFPKNPMKTKPIPLIALIGLALLTAIPAKAQISDDFNTGNDNNWTRLSPLTFFSAPAVYSFPGGNSYQISSPVSPNPGLSGPARAGSLRLDQSYSSYFQQSVDIVDWDNSQSNTAIGMLARVSQPGLATTDGYSLTVNLNGVFEINRITNEQPASLVATGSIGTLNPANDYRLVFTGDGSLLTGQIFNVADLATPLATISGIDATYASGNSGLFIFTSSGTQTVTATFDNYASATFGTPLAKANNSNNLNLGTSWLGGVAPTSADRAKWDSTVTGANTTSLGADLTWAGIVIAGPTGPVTINPGNTLALGAGLVDIDLSAADQDLTLNCNLALQAPNVWDVKSGRTLTLGGLVSGSAGVTKQGAGTAILSNSNTYTGGTTISAGTLKLSGTGTPGAAGANVAVSSGALLDLNGTHQSIAFTAGTGAGTVANNAGSGTSTLTLSANPAANVIIADNTNSSNGKIAVVVPVNCQGLSASNTYSGGTTVNAGAYLYNNPGASGTGTITLTALGANGATSSGLVVNGGIYDNDITGAGYIHNNSNSGATVITTTFTGNINTSGPFIFRAGTGIVYKFAGDGTTSVLSGVIGSTTSMVNGAVATGSIIKSGTGTLTLSGNNLYTGTTTITGGTLKNGSASVFTNKGALTISGGNFDLGGFGASFTLMNSTTTGSSITNSGTAANLTLNTTNTGLLATSGSSIAIGSGVTITKSTTLYLGANSSSGSTPGGDIVINSGGTVRTTNGISLVINGDGTNITVNSGGTLSQTGGGTGSLAVGQLAGSNNTLTVAGGTASSTGKATASPNAGLLVGNSGTGTVTMTSGAVTTSTSGAVVLFGNSASSTGNVFNLNGGILTTDGIAVANGTAAFNFGGGTIKSNTGFTWANHANMTATVNDGGLTVDTNGNSASIAQALLHGSGATTDSLTKSGLGTLTLSGVNTYTGSTTVSGGTLVLLGGSQASPIVVEDGASLGFDITAPTSSTKAVTLNAGHKITVNGSPTLASYTLLTTTASISGTPNLDPEIPGYNVIVDGGNTLKLVSTPTNTFTSWISNPAFGLAPADQDLGDDPDGDGIDNGVENFFGTNPGVFSSGLVAVSASGGTFTFTHPQNAAPASDLAAAYTWSKDLATFLANGATDGAGSTVSFTTQANTPSQGITTVTATVTGTATSKLFVRVVVTGP
jgi:fibronectin-binding autotransporter adhesin